MAVFITPNEEIHVGLKYTKMLSNAYSVTIYMRKLTELISDETTLFGICVAAGKLGCLRYKRYWTNKTCMFPRKRHVDGVSQTGTNRFYLFIKKRYWENVVTILLKFDHCVVPFGLS